MKVKLEVGTKLYITGRGLGSASAFISTSFFSFTFNVVM